MKVVIWIMILTTLSLLLGCKGATVVTSIPVTEPSLTTEVVTQAAQSTTEFPEKPPPRSFLTPDERRLMTLLTNIKDAFRDVWSRFYQQYEDIIHANNKVRSAPTFLAELINAGASSRLSANDLLRVPQLMAKRILEKRNTPSNSRTHRRRLGYASPVDDDDNDDDTVDEEPVAESVIESESTQVVDESNNKNNQETKELVARNGKQIILTPTTDQINATVSMNVKPEGPPELPDDDGGLGGGKGLGGLKVNVNVDVRVGDVFLPSDVATLESSKRILRVLTKNFN